MKSPASAEFVCVGDVKVSRPARGSAAGRELQSLGSDRAVPRRGDHPRVDAVIWKAQGGPWQCCLQQQWGLKLEKNPVHLETITFFKAKTFSHNTRAAGNSSASDPTRVFKALLCSEAQQVTADLLCGIISL